MPAMLFIAPAVAWTVWLRRPRPRPKPLLAVALFATTPLATGLAGAVWGAIVTRSFGGGEDVEPSQKARRLAEGISFAMNMTFWIVIAGVVAGVIFAASRWRGRRRPR
jgi:hypothetical protein